MHRCERIRAPLRTAFAKTRPHHDPCLQAAENLRGAPYLLPLEEITRRTAEAAQRGATEVCMQVRAAGCHAHGRKPDIWPAARVRSPETALVFHYADKVCGTSGCRSYTHLRVWWVYVLL